MAISKPVILNSKTCWRSQTQCVFPPFSMARYIVEEENYFLWPIYILQGALPVRLCRPLVHAWIRRGEGVFSSRQLRTEHCSELHVKLGCRMSGIRLCPSLLTWTHLCKLRATGHCKNQIAKDWLWSQIPRVCLFLSDSNIKGRFNILFVSKIS